MSDMPIDWIKEEVSYSDLPVAENESFKKELDEFTSQYKPGDKIFKFSGDLFGPGTLSYRAGYVIIRENEQVAHLLTIMS